MRNREQRFGGEKALDVDDKTYWATNDGVNRATLEVDTEGPVEINAVMISEAAGMTGHVQSYRVEGMENSTYVLLSEGTTIGDRKVDRFPKITVWKIRLTINGMQEYAAIQKFGAYLAPTNQDSR